MSSWLGTLENFLDRVDQAAGQALLKDAEPEPVPKAPDSVYYQREWEVPRMAPAVSVSQFSSFQSIDRSPLPQPTQTFTAADRNLKTVNNSELVSLPAKTKGPSAKDPDQELFEFLNSTDVVDTSGVAHSRDSRPPSTTSSVSSRSRRSPEGGHEIVTNIVTPSLTHGNSSVTIGIESTSPYQFVSADTQDNEMVKSEFASMNREMQILMQRLQSTQDELSVCQRQLESQRRQLMMSEHTSTELRRREADCREALAAKDAQIGVLRTRLEEADRDIESMKRQVAELSSNQDKMLVEQSSSSGMQRQTVDVLQEKLNDLESTLQRERDEHQRATDEATRHHSRLEADKQSLMAEISTLQKSLNRERARSTELSSQLKSARSQCESAKQELGDYKDKASRILQSKEKLIFSLKDGSTGGKSSGVELAVLVSELDSARQERDVLREQLQTTQLALESLRIEMSELESQMQHESDTSQEQITSLEDQLRAERRRREDAEFDITKQKQEMRAMHDELVKQKTGFQSRIQSRDDEIGRLRSQLVAKSMNASNQEELENRLRALTESLIQKQTTLESLSTEKNSLLLQLERMDKQCREAETSALRAASSNVNMAADDDEVRQRLPAFMKQSPLDGNVTRKVKMAAGVIDRMGIHLGVFLRRYPVARVMVVVYMALLHLWVMIVMLTYQPEMHHGDYKGQAALPLPP